MLLNANPGVVWVDKDGVYNISSAALELVPRKYIEAILNLDPTLNHQIVYQYTAFIIDGLIAGGGLDAVLCRKKSRRNIT